MSQELIIEAGRSEGHYWRDLWRYRELFGFLAWRDVLVRYKQTTFGIAWAVMRPLLTTLIFVFAFQRIAGLPSGGEPYAIMVLAANIPWMFFANALSESSQSLIGNASLISKIYFPRMILPASALIVALVDCLICLGLLPCFMLWFGHWPTWRLLSLPIFIALALLAAMGPGLLVTALNVKYRDFRYIVPFIVQFGLFVSPVGFSTEVVRAKFGATAQMIYSMNPMVGVIDGFRWAICGTGVIHWPSFLLSTALSVGLLILGIWYFRKTERTFADVI